jgi:hypothetical protein
MAVKPLEIRSAALAEFKPAVAWHRERSQAAAVTFVTEVD